MLRVDLTKQYHRFMIVLLILFFVYVPVTALVTIPWWLGLAIGSPFGYWIAQGDQ